MLSKFQIVINIITFSFCLYQSSFFFFFFFSSRRRHTRLQGDWSSDVCSSDLRIACRYRPSLWKFERSLAFCSKPANAQISKVMDDSGRRFFINAEPARATKLGGQSTLPGQSAMAGKSRATIYLPAESSLTGAGRPALSISRDGVEKLVREAAERHRVDPALVRAVIETESN